MQYNILRALAILLIALTDFTRPEVTVGIKLKRLRVTSPYITDAAYEFLCVRPDQLRSQTERSCETKSQVTITGSHSHHIASAHFNEKDIPDAIEYQMKTPSIYKVDYYDFFTYKSPRILFNLISIGRNFSFDFDLRPRPIPFNIHPKMRTSFLMKNTTIDLQLDAEFKFYCNRRWIGPQCNHIQPSSIDREILGLRIAVSLLAIIVAVLIIILVTKMLRDQYCRNCCTRFGRGRSAEEDLLYNAL